MVQTHRLQECIAELDGLLTDKHHDARRHAAHRGTLLADPVRFLCDASASPYHLSDGGYSRLLISEDGFVIGLDSISREEVKARWHDTDVQACVARIDAILAAALQAEMGGRP